MVIGSHYFKKPSLIFIVVAQPAPSLLAPSLLIEYHLIKHHYEENLPNFSAIQNLMID